MSDDVRLPSFSLAGRTALVTGASSGLGMHFARLLAAAGATVSLAARRVDRLESLREELVGAGGRAIAVPMDVTCRDSVDRAVAATAEQLGRIDVLVNNAGMADPARFLDVSEEAWQRTLDTNLTGAWRVAQEVARTMVANGRGSIINLASVTALRPTRGTANYGTAKAGVIQLTQIMALELGRKGVRVNAIAPGYILTELTHDLLNGPYGEKFVSKLFPGRAADPHELDGAMLLLASDAGSYIQGTVVIVDGGTILTQSF